MAASRLLRVSPDSKAAAASAIMGKRTSQPAGYLAAARIERTTQAPGRPSSLHGGGRKGDRRTNPDACTSAGGGRRGQEAHPRRGRPKARDNRSRGRWRRGSRRAARRRKTRKREAPKAGGEKRPRAGN